ELEPIPPVVARAGEPVALVRPRMVDSRFGYVLLVDDESKPIGWIEFGGVPRDGSLDPALAVPASALVSRETTLKDVLSMMLDADVQAAIVVDRQGQVEGLVTLETITDRLREERERADAAAVPAR